MVESTGLENRRCESIRGFESHSLRQFISCLQKYPSGRRGSPAKGVGGQKPREGSNPSFCAKKRRFLKAVAFFVFCSMLFIFRVLYLAFCRRRRLLNTRGSYPQLRAKGRPTGGCALAQRLRALALSRSPHAKVRASALLLELPHARVGLVLLQEGFERRLLATVRWGVSRALPVADTAR